LRSTTLSLWPRSFFSPVSLSGAVCAERASERSCANERCGLAQPFSLPPLGSLRSPITQPKADQHDTSFDRLLEAMVRPGILACGSSMVSLAIACVRSLGSRNLPLHPGNSGDPSCTHQERSSRLCIRLVDCCIHGLLHTNGAPLRVDVMGELWSILGTDQQDISLPGLFHGRCGSWRRWCGDIHSPDQRSPARRWWLWLAAALFTFFLMVGVAIAAMRQPAASSMWGVAVAVGFCFSCAASTFAVLAVFSRLVKGEGRVWKLLGDSAFGIYLVHYTFVTWLQYWLLPIKISAIPKGTMVASGALLLSLGFVQAWKKLPLKRSNPNARHLRRPS